MPDQEDEGAERRRRWRALAAAGGPEIDGPIGMWARRLPELRVLLEGDPEDRTVAVALARASAKHFTELGDDVMAGRIEDDLKRKTSAGAERVWGSPEQRELFNAMTTVLAGQETLNIKAAAREVAAQEPWVSQGVTTEAIRQRWIAWAKLNRMSITELARAAVREARDQGSPDP